jgi:ABC-type Mn2+/Zn2+ transport system ATPase subunit
LYRLLSHDDGILQFSLSPTQNENNRFTAILGPNGTGKSQLLRSIAETYRGEGARVELVDHHDHKLTRIQRPRRLLVLSNMVMDVFTNTTKDRASYRYLGLRQASNNSSTGSLRDATAGSILECFADMSRRLLLEPVLEQMGVSACLVSFVKSRKRPSQVSDAKEIFEKFFDRNDITDRRSSFPSNDELAQELSGFLATIANDERVYAFDSLEMGHFWDMCERFAVAPAELMRLLRRYDGLELRLHLDILGRLVELDALSAGQLLFLSTFARIAANVVPNSLVIVDEPETGLHPNWQSSWIPLMRNTIPTSYGCHIFVASHSPYIVSDADDVLIPEGRWGAFVQFDEPYKGRSVENILYRVFHARVAGNLMVEKDLTALMAFISESEPSASSKSTARLALNRIQELSGEDTQNINAIIAQATRKLA